MKKIDKKAQRIQELCSWIATAIGTGHGGAWNTGPGSSNHRGRTPGFRFPIGLALLALAVAPFGGPGAAAAEEAAEACGLVPPYNVIEVPASGLAWLPGESFGARECDPVPEDAWTAAGGTRGMRVYANGPGGSGRYWAVTVGFGPAWSRLPDRGFCLTTTTLGWRTLQHFGRTPLPWLEDRDGDGEPELVLWGSSALHEEAPTVAALVAWVYRVAGKDRLRLDPELSRALAAEIAAAYRAPLDADPARLAEVRAAAAATLERFAAGRCRLVVPGEP